MTIPSLAGRLPQTFPLPIVLCMVCASALVGIGDQFPFSPFPMYANVDRRAEVLYVTNEKDEVLPTSKLFGSSSAQLKKQYESYLEKIAGTRDYDRASPDQLQQAGQKMLDFLFGLLRPHRVARFKPQSIKVWLLTINAETGEFKKTRVSVGERAISINAAP